MHNYHFNVSLLIMKTLLCIVKYFFINCFLSFSPWHVTGLDYIFLLRQGCIIFSCCVEFRHSPGTAAVNRLSRSGFLLFLHRNIRGFFLPQSLDTIHNCHSISLGHRVSTMKTQSRYPKKTLMNRQQEIEIKLYLVAKF